MQLARVVLAAGLLLAACLVYLQLLGPEPQPEKELRLARMGFRERCAGAYRLLRGATRWDSVAYIGAACGSLHQGPYVEWFVDRRGLSQDHHPG